MPQEDTKPPSTQDNTNPQTVTQRLVQEDEPVRSSGLDLPPSTPTEEPITEGEEMLSLEELSASDVEIAAKPILPETSDETETETSDETSDESAPVEKPAPATVESPEVEKEEETTASQEELLEDKIASIFSEAPNANITTPKPADRIFDGLAEDEKPLFKQMSNDAYNKLYPEILGLRKQSQNASAYNNPESYKLTPQYSEALSNYSQLDTYVKHLESQLLRPDNKLIPLTTDVNNNVVAGAEIEVSEADRAVVRQNILQLQQEQNQHLIEVEGLQKTFQDQHSNRKDQITSLLSKFGSHATAPDTPETQEMNKFLSNIGLDKDFLSPVVGVFYNTLVTTLKENIALKAQIDNKTSLSKEQQQAGPTKSDSSGDQSTAKASGDDYYTMADMKTALAI